MNDQKRDNATGQPVLWSAWLGIIWGFICLLWIATFWLHRENRRLDRIQSLIPLIQQNNFQGQHSDSRHPRPDQKPSSSGAPDDPGDASAKPSSK